MSILGNKLKRYFKSRLNYNDIQKIILEYENKHIEFITENAKIEYRNVISPTEGRLSFPDGFFDEKYFSIPDSEEQKCREIIENCLCRLPLKNKIDMLPPGATYNVYLHLVDKGNNNFYYSATYTITEQVEPLFFELFTFFEKYCDFPKRQIYNSVDFTGGTVRLDERYFNETLWLCPQCNNGNLFEHKRCVFCGAYRSW